MRANQHLIRSTLCDNPALMGRTTLFAFGLGAAPGSCYIFSDDNNKARLEGMFNEGDGGRGWRGKVKPAK
jgi:hypothetical protein